MSLESKAVGAAFEAWIETQHTIAERLGILAHVVHNQPTATFIGGRLIYTAAGVADYTGTLDRSGLTLAVEAKSTQADKLARSAVEPKQQQHLEAVARAGGLALLLVEFRQPGVLRNAFRFAIPWLKVPWKIARTKENLYLDDLLDSEWKIRGVISDGDCYLSKFHAPGPSSNPRGHGPARRFARE